MGNQVHPEPNWTLGYFGLLDHEFVGLNWVIENHVIFLVKSPILQVDNGRTNKVVTENHVVIPDLNFQNSVFGQLNNLVDFFIELGIVTVLDVFIFELS